MNSAEKFKRYTRKPMEFKLVDLEGKEDTFKFKPLNMEQMALAVEISNLMKNIEGKTIMTKEAMNATSELLVSVIMESYPDLDKQTAKDFVSNNMTEMQDIIEKLMPDVDNSKKKIIDKLEKEKEDGKSS